MTWALKNVSIKFFRFFHDLNLYNDSNWSMVSFAKEKRMVKLLRLLSEVATDHFSCFIRQLEVLLQRISILGFYLAFRV